MNPCRSLCVPVPPATTVLISEGVQMFLLRQTRSINLWVTFRRRCCFSPRLFFTLGVRFRSSVDAKRPKSSRRLQLSRRWLRSARTGICLNSFCVNIPEYFKGQITVCLYCTSIYFLFYYKRWFSSHLHIYITVWILFDNFSLDILIMFIVLMERYLFLSLWLQ